MVVCTILNLQIIKMMKINRKYISSLYLLPLAPDLDSECGFVFTNVIKSEAGPATLYAPSIGQVH
jgi:hypothetical protein